MIKNERQYRITKAAAEKFKAAIAAAERDGPGAKVSPALHRASVAGLRSQLGDLEAELRTYDQLKSPAGSRRLTGTIADIGALLIQARIARGWTQAQLGERLGVHMQKIQQYEASNYAGASVTRLQEIVAALGLTVQISVRVTPQAGAAADAVDASARRPAKATRR